MRYYVTACVVRLDERQTGVDKPTHFTVVSMWVILSAIIAVLALSRFLKCVMSRKMRKPPRVPGLPLLGNILQVKTTAMHHGLSECAKKYGDIFSIKLMGLEIVVVNSAELIQEACLKKGHDFADRLKTTYVHNVGLYEGNDLVAGPYTRAVSLFRKTVHASIKTYGEESTRIEELIQNELEVLVDSYEETGGKPSNPQPDLRASLTNIIGCLLIGRRVDKNSTEARNIDTMVSELIVFTTPGYGAELDLFPFLRWLPLKSVQCLKRFVAARDAALNPMYEEAKASFDPKCIGSFLDMLLEARKCQLAPDGTSMITKNNILGAMILMFLAGVITTFSTVSSLILICLHRPDVQKKLQEEIDLVIGQHNMPALEHRPEMHFLNATVLETLRYVSVAALSPRCAARDTTLGGYDIKKGTTVLLNIWEAHHSAEWKDPWEFRPERFLDEKGVLLPRDHPTRARLIPFGAGHRSCVGETFARKRVFLFIATLWQKFSFLPETEAGLPSHDPRDFILTAAVTPRPFYCKIMKR